MKAKIYIQYDNGITDKVRLIGIIAPSIAGAVAEYLHKQGREEEAESFEERIENANNKKKVS